MVPQNSTPAPEPARKLSKETLLALRDVIAERWRALEQSQEHLRAAIRIVAAEAKERGLRAEELIITLKALEGEMFSNAESNRPADPTARRRFREWLITTCLEAYYDP